MEYFKDLPEISYSGTDENENSEFEIEGQIKFSEHKPKDIVFVGRMGNTIYLAFGDVVHHDYIPPERAASGNAFTRLTIEGTCVMVHPVSLKE